MNFSLENSKFRRPRNKFTILPLIFYPYDVYEVYYYTHADVMASRQCYFHQVYYYYNSVIHSRDNDAYIIMKCSLYVNTNGQNNTSGKDLKYR